MMKKKSRLWHLVGGCSEVEQQQQQKHDYSIFSVLTLKPEVPAVEN